jgi:SAM-dependent methyltransferase
MNQHQTQNAAILDQFTRQAGPYTDLVRNGQDTGLPLLLEATRPMPDDRVLDVACGGGSTTLALATVTSGAVGIDLTPAMIERARALQAERGVANVEWRVGDVLPLPFEDASFSLVVSRAAFHHMTDPRAVLAEMARVCAPGGRLAVMDLTPADAKAEAFNRIERLRDPSHVRALKQDELRALGEGLGLVETHAIALENRPMTLNSVLATSFPNPGDLETLRALYRRDADGGEDSLGLRAEPEGDEIVVHYPMTLVVWRRSHG